MISYRPLWEKMEEKNVTTYKLIKHGIDKRTIHNLKNNANITMVTTERLCKILECEIKDIVEFVDD